MATDLSNATLAELLEVADKLNYAGYFDDVSSVLDFFEKPWNWQSEYEEALEEDNE